MFSYLLYLLGIFFLMKSVIISFFFFFLGLFLMAIDIGVG